MLNKPLFKYTQCKTMSHCTEYTNPLLSTFLTDLPSTVLAVLCGNVTKMPSTHPPYPWLAGERGLDITPRKLSSKLGMIQLGL